MLLDPKKLVSEEKLNHLDKKLSMARMILSRFPKDGGMPFVYCFTATKQHYLSDDFPHAKEVDEKSNPDELKGTASTNGKRYNWHPDFLNLLTVKEIINVMVHETYHIVMQHCNTKRVYGRNPLIWNLAVDYVVNNSIEYDFKVGNELVSNFFVRECEAAYKDKSKVHPLWSGNLGEPYILSELLVDIAKSLQEKNEKDDKKKEAKASRRVTYVDPSLYGRSPESIYDEIMDTIKKNGGGGDLNDLLGKLKLFNSFDEHETSEVDKHKLFEEILSATTTTRNMRGNVPGCIEDQLHQLENPKLKWEDIVRQSMQSVRQDKGSKNDWSRFRRRAMALDLYRPKKRDQFINWLCLLDTSGSMSDEDIAYGVSQLKVLDSRSQGIVVPCDASVHWDKAVKITNADDLSKVKIFGRGGTVFDDFFNDYTRYIREKIDLLIVVTDGGFSLNCKTPKVDTVFVITNDHMPTVPFGRVAPLRSY